MPFDKHKPRKGDAKVFQQLFEKYYPKLKALACRFVNEQTAEDMTQEVFIDYWENRKTVNTEYIYTYLNKCLQNKCLNYLKHKKVVEQYAARKLAAETRIAEVRISYLNHAPDFDNETMKQLIAKDLKERIANSVDKLPPKCAQAFRLCYFHDLKHKEIAGIMKISTRTVETHIRNAMSELRVSLQDILLIAIMLYNINVFFL